MIPTVSKLIELSHDKTNKMACAPREDSDQPVLLESLLCAQWVFKDPRFLHVVSEDWSDWADAEADLSPWVNRSFCWCCHVAAQLSVVNTRYRHVAAQLSLIYIRYPLEHGCYLQVVTLLCPQLQRSCGSILVSDCASVHVSARQKPCMLGFWNFIYGFLMEK